MDSPRYGEIVELLQRTNGDGGGRPAAAPGTAPAASDRGSELLSADSIVLDGGRASRDEAITQAGDLLVRAGAVDPSYVPAMHERETSVSTYMGNLLAIPHGTNEAKGAIRRTAISLVRYPGGVEWKGKEVQFVIGIAGQGNDHMALLGKIAHVFLDKTEIARLQAATSASEIHGILGGVKV
jgi:PTS system mannitol-specific IIC component